MPFRPVLFSSFTCSDKALGLPLSPIQNIRIYTHACMHLFPGLRLGSFALDPPRKVYGISWGRGGAGFTWKEGRGGCSMLFYSRIMFIEHRNSFLFCFSNK